MAGSVLVQFSDGSFFADAITQFSLFSSLLGFNSSDISSLTVSTSGVATLVNNSWRTATLTAFSKCGDGLYSTFDMAGNLAPANYDTKLGFSSGLTFPPASYGQSVDASIQVQVSLSPLTTYQIWLFYNSDVFGAPIVSKGIGWQTGAFDFTVGNSVTGNILKAVLSFSSGYSATNAAIHMASVTFPVITSLPVLELITANVVALSVASGNVFQSATGLPVVAGTAYVSLNGGSVPQLRRRLLNIASYTRQLSQTLSLPLVTGDCNGDGFFNAYDATYAQQLVTNGVGSWPVSSVSQMRNCAPTYSYMFNSVKSIYAASDIIITIADVSYLLHASTNRLFFLNISSPYDLVASVPSEGTETWNATASFFFYPASTAIVDFSTAPCLTSSGYFELNVAFVAYSVSVGTFYGNSSVGVVFQGLCNSGTFALSVVTQSQATLNMSVGFENRATGDAYSFYGMDVGIFVNPSTNFVNVEGSLIVSGPIFTLDLNVSNFFVASSSFPTTWTPASQSPVASSAIPTKELAIPTKQPTMEPSTAVPSSVEFTYSPTNPAAVSSWLPTSVPPTTEQPITEPTMTPTSTPTPAPIAIALSVALFGLEVGGISLSLTMSYSTSSPIYSSYSAVAPISLLSDGTHGPYVFSGASTHTYLRYQESLSFTVRLDSDAAGYTCYLNTYSAKQTLSFSAPIASPILLYCVSTAAQEAGVTPPATGSAGFTCGSNSGAANSSQVNATLCASIISPGTRENQDFTAGVTSSISQALGISNSSVSVIVSVDTNGNPQLLLVFATSSSSSAACNFRGNITLSVSIGGTIVMIHIGPYSSQLTGWVLANVVSLISLPLYISAPIGIAAVVVLIVSVCMFRKKFPNVRILPVLSLLFSTVGFATNLLFVAYLNNVRSTASNGSAATGTCSVAPASTSSLALSATVMMSLASLSLCTCAVLGWFSAARLLLPASQHRSSFLYSSRDLVGAAKSEPIGSNSYQFERWKKKHKCTIYAVIFICALSPKHMLVLHSRFGGLQMFDCPFPKKATAYIRLWDLFPILVVYIPFTVLQLASTVLLSGWTPQVTVSVIISLVQLVFNIATSTREYCKQRFSCCKRLADNQFCPSIADMKRFLCGKVRLRKVFPSQTGTASLSASMSLESQTDFGVASMSLSDRSMEPSPAGSRSSSSSSLSAVVAAAPEQEPSGHTIIIHSEETVINPPLPEKSLNLPLSEDPAEAKTHLPLAEDTSTPTDSTSLPSHAQSAMLPTVTTQSHIDLSNDAAESNDQTVAPAVFTNSSASPQELTSSIREQNRLPSLTSPLSSLQAVGRMLPPADLNTPEVVCLNPIYISITPYSIGLIWT